ncbi:hypothetical protein [Bradyrhizobium sp. HKCCYLR20261]|uniref:hypothetical protein n=1 Tax=Bradyrhizobium sp. HKCCYLR20261 TaxID=3420760 RepID=UPI003EC11FB1
MRKVCEEGSVGDAVDQAQQIIFELAEEMREAFEALPDQLKEYHVRRRDAAEWLEVASDSLIGLSTYHMRSEEYQIRWVEMRPGKDGKLNRPARRDNVVGSLHASIFRLAELNSKLGDKKVLKLIGELKRIRDTLKSIEFPGMST